jgi:hypothetical protein
MVAAACFELSGPPSGLVAVSPIQVAWPSVVVDDVLRDGAGAIAPLRVEAYDGDGNVLDDATVSFIAIDTGLHVGPDGVVHGDNARTSPARIVAQVRRAGDVLQTPEIRLDVVPRPDSVAPAQDTTFAAKPIPALDPSPIPSDSLRVKVLNRGTTGATPTPVRSWIVRYEIIAEPPGVNGQRTALFSGGGAATVSLDTTDADGVASRLIVLQRALLEPATGRQNVQVRVTVGNTRSGGAATVFIITLPYDRQ